MVFDVGFDCKKDGNYAKKNLTMEACVIGSRHRWWVKSYKRPTQSQWGVHDVESLDSLELLIVYSLFLCCIVLATSYLKVDFGHICISLIYKVVFGNICTSLIYKGCFWRLLVASCNPLKFMSNDL